MNQLSREQKRKIIQIGIIVGLVIGAVVAHNLLTTPNIPVPPAEAR